jgi:predicted metalloprotease with PDZ domain
VIFCLCRVKSSFLRLGVGAAFFGFALSAHSEIAYLVKVDPVAKRVEVSMTVPAQPGIVTVQIPNWMPGHYILEHYSKKVHDVTAVDEKGVEIPVQHPDDSTWTIAGSTGPATFRYWVPFGATPRFSLPNDDSFVQLAGAANYMYVVGLKTERCKITYDLPAGWPALTGLDKTGRTPNTFSAPTYDVLADAPLSTGTVLVDHPVYFFTDL